MAKGTTVESNDNTSTSSGNNLLQRTGFEKDHLYCAEGQSAFDGEVHQMQWNPAATALAILPTSTHDNSTPQYTSPIIACDFPATEFLPSWNIKLTDPHQGFQIFMRFYDQSTGEPSQWMFVGEGGNLPHDTQVLTKDPHWGQTRVDYIDLIKPATAFQYQIRCQSEASGNPTTGPFIRRIYIHYSGKTGNPYAFQSDPTPLKTTLTVPYRSQLTVDKVELRNQICCPTSLAMVLEHNGTTKDTLDICAEVYDARNDIYGVWPRTSHAAYQHGLQSWVHRFRTHQEVATVLSLGQPIIASIRVGEGELRGAQYPKSNGHIIVITGITEQGDYIVNDPASAGPKGAEILYFASDIEKVWLDKGGVAILVKPEKR